MHNIDSFFREYEVDFKEMTIAGEKFRFATPRTIDRFLDLNNIEHDFPLWAKIWKASWILAEYVAKHPPDPAKHILEIGAGIGVVGVVASFFGHRITLTEYNAHALNFARANAEINQCSGVKVKKLDWHQPALHETFDWIIGSEVLYHDRDFEPLMALLRRYLKPGGIITLSLGIRQDGLGMIDKMQRFYDMKIKKYTIRSEEGATRFLLCSMTPKPSQLELES
jgi:predicted nicotinamide N-methyase